MNVTIDFIDAGKTMDIVRELRAQGLVQGKDFDFAFNQTRWDEMIGEIPSYTSFTFYNDKHATWFVLKYK